MLIGLPRSLKGKDFTCQAGDAGDTGHAGLIPGSGRFLEEEMATHSSILAWEIPRTEELGGLQSLSGKELHMTGN